MRQTTLLVRMRQLVIGGLGVSAVVHVSQLIIYGTSLSVVVVSVFGLAYALIAWAHVRRNPLAPMLSVILPTIGATLGILRFVLLSPNAGSVIDVLLDVILVIPASIVLWKTHAYTVSTAESTATIPRT